MPMRNAVIILMAATTDQYITFSAYFPKHNTISQLFN